MRKCRVPTTVPLSFAAFGFNPLRFFQVLNVLDEAQAVDNHLLTANEKRTLWVEGVNMKYERVAVGEVKCVDDGKTMGVHASTGDGIVTLIFTRATDHKQMDELAGPTPKTRVERDRHRLGVPKAGLRASSCWEYRHARSLSG